MSMRFSCGPDGCHAESVDDEAFRKAGRDFGRWFTLKSLTGPAPGIDESAEYLDRAYQRNLNIKAPK